MSQTIERLGIIAALQTQKQFLFVRSPVATQENGLQGKAKTEQGLPTPAWQACLAYLGSDATIAQQLSSLATPKALTPDLWETVSGGVKEGEPLLHALTREVREELGINVKLAQCIPFNCLPELQIQQTRNNQPYQFKAFPFQVLLSPQQLSQIRGAMPTIRISAGALERFLRDYAEALRPATQLLIAQMLAYQP